MSSAGSAAVNGSLIAGSAKSAAPGASVRGTSSDGIAAVWSRSPRSSRPGASVACTPTPCPTASSTVSRYSISSPASSARSTSGASPIASIVRRTNTGSPAGCSTVSDAWHSHRGTDRPPSENWPLTRNSDTSRCPPRSRTSPRTTTSGSAGSGANEAKRTRSSDLDRLGAAALAPAPDALRLAVTIEPLLARRLRVRAPRRLGHAAPGSRSSSANVNPNADGTSWSSAGGRSSAVPVLALVGHDPAVGQIVLGQRVERDRARRPHRRRRPAVPAAAIQTETAAPASPARSGRPAPPAAPPPRRRSARSDRRGSTPRARRAARAATSPAATQTPSSSIAIDPAGAALRLPFAFGLPCSPCATSSRVALVVQLEQPVEHLLARRRREREPRPELRLVEAVAEVEVGPAVRVADRVVELRRAARAGGRCRRRARPGRGRGCRSSSGPPGGRASARSGARSARRRGCQPRRSARAERTSRSSRSGCSWMSVRSVDDSRDRPPPVEAAREQAEVRVVVVGKDDDLLVEARCRSATNIGCTVLLTRAIAMQRSSGAIAR